jgi:hypothetical protein
VQLAVSYNFLSRIALQISWECIKTQTILPGGGVVWWLEFSHNNFYTTERLLVQTLVGAYSSSTTVDSFRILKIFFFSKYR